MRQHLDARDCVSMSRIEFYCVNLMSVDNNIQLSFSLFGTKSPELWRAAGEKGGLEGRGGEDEIVNGVRGCGRESGFVPASHGSINIASIQHQFWAAVAG